MIIYYKNHLNEVYNIGDNGIYINECSVRDFKWTYSKKTSKITAFRKDISEFTLSLVIHGKTEEATIGLKNKIYEIAEVDVVTAQAGRLYIGDCYISCFVVESKKSNYSYAGHAKLDLTCVTDNPYWIRETTTQFGTNETLKGKNLDFKSDFNYDFSPNSLGTSLYNPGFSDTNFIMRLYGPCDNPSISINGHNYTVYKSVKANEYIEINSITKKITLVGTSGVIDNCFNYRDRDSYIFQKIKPGTSVVSRNGGFKFDIILMEERSEPLWT